MTQLDPVWLFERLARDLPGDLHGNVIVVGSLAAAYHFQDRLRRRGVNTKDADLVVHPAGDTVSCAAMAGRLLALGWRRHPDRCFPRDAPQPVDALRAIRLYPPDSEDYYVEFLNLPDPDQEEPIRWIPVELGGGWYGLPAFRFMGLAVCGRLPSEAGIEYSAPGMMALSGLLSHPVVHRDRMSEPVGGRAILRSAKDLGRVLALAHLSSREEVEGWLAAWREGLVACFPAGGRALARRAGDGLRDLLARPDALEEAHHTCQVGLLAGQLVTVDNLRATGEQMLADVIEPLEAEP